MKNFSTIFTAILIISSLFLFQQVIGQAPQKMSYQAVIRDAGNNLVTSHVIGIQVSIWQGSIDGTAVYSEIQTTNTNSNGLISIEIGGGTGFDLINWANGPYFIKTETDPTGGTTYTISGISQLLSVPYAMYAQISGSSTPGPKGDKGDAGLVGPKGDSGTIGPKGDKGDAGVMGPKGDSGAIGPKGDIGDTGTTGPKGDAGTIGPKGDKGDIGDPGIAFNDSDVLVTKTWTSAKIKFELDHKISSDSVSTVAKTGSYNDLINKPAMDGSETKLLPGTSISISGEGTNTSPYIVNTTNGVFTHYIGELFGGGIIVSIWKKNNIEHGLIASLVDISSGYVWSNDTELIGTLAQSLIDGVPNTNAIITQPGHITSAAQLCKDYNGGGFTDWYLPALWELNKCYDAAFIVNTVLGVSDGFQFGYYWSSTEYDSKFSWGRDFDYASADESSKSQLSKVRAIRRF